MFCTTSDDLIEDISEIEQNTFEEKHCINAPRNTHTEKVQICQNSEQQNCALQLLIIARLLQAVAIEVVCRALLHIVADTGGKISLHFLNAVVLPSLKGN